MKFMATWRIHEAKRHDALKTFSQMTTDDDQTDMGSNIKLIGRWHDLQRFTGVAIFDHVEDRQNKRPFQAPRRC